MGLVVCTIHGDQGVLEICEHIWEALEEGSIPEMETLPILGTKICSKCYQGNLKQDSGQITLDELFELPEAEQDNLAGAMGSIYSGLERRVVCAECFNQKRLDNARRAGKELPFEPYENTLMGREEEVIEKLRTFLQSNFKFQKSIVVDFEMDAFHLRSGGISYPFSIEFYYITKKEDQAFVLQLIDQFFESIPQKQRKISFYEAENWIRNTHPDGTSAHRGPEKLLWETNIR
jgi:hypothetical protein